MMFSKYNVSILIFENFCKISLCAMLKSFAYSHNGIFVIKVKSGKYVMWDEIFYLFTLKEMFLRISKISFHSNRNYRTYFIKETK